MKGTITNININGYDYKFIIGASAKFDNDLQRVRDILEKGVDNLTVMDRYRLLMIYHASYHDSGKIEGVTSFDSSATNCMFCKCMQQAADGNPLHICGNCYDKAQEESYKGVNVLNRHTLNMIIMMTVEFTREELKAINGVTLIDRVNSSGDTPNKIYAKNMLNIAYINPHAKFGYWAKNTAAVIAACDEIGKPENVTLVQSSPIIGVPAKLAKYFDVVFTVYATREDVAAAVAAGARECNGQKCMDCGYKCYLNGWNYGDNIAEYLRGVPDMKTRKALSAAARAIRARAMEENAA